MASENKSIDSPSNKIEKNKKKYTNRDEILNDVNDLDANILKKIERQPGVSNKKFQGDLKEKQEEVELIAITM